MGRLDEAFSRQFREWEIRGRGGRLFGSPVALEPPFAPFTGYRVPHQRGVDDGRHETGLSRFWNLLTAPQAEPEPEEEIEAEPEPVFRDAEPAAELQLTLPTAKPFPSSNYEGWLHQVCRASEPFAFELLATANEIVPQFAGLPDAIERIDRALPQFLPELTTLGGEDALFSAWIESAPQFATVELGLGAEFLIPLARTKADVLSAVVNAMDEVRDDEFALYQVLIEPALNDWAESIVPFVTGIDGKPLFANRPDLFAGVERKLASPFLAVVVRFAACAANAARCWRIIYEMIAPFKALYERGGNHLMPLSNDGYDYAAHENDILLRSSHRSGMLLNVDELIPFISFPSAAVSRRLRRQTARTRQAPEELRRQGSLLLGENPHAGRVSEVWLRPEQRVRHMHLVGPSGTGKSTFLFNMIRQDIERGEGIALLDPHGDLVERVLGVIPPERHDDVVLVDPSDEEHIVGFNILAAHSDFERNLLASDLVSTFRRISTTWGEQMNSVLRNAILAFLESSRGGTIADMQRFLLDAAFRKQFLRTVTNPNILFYWERAFPQLTGNKSIGSVSTRLDEFLSREPIRYMVSQQENRLDFADILDNGRILLVKLPQGQIGRENANLLGSIFVSKIQQMAMSRQRLHESERRDFWVYLDEFHSFITPSMAEILTGARKYRVGLILAHQELHQLEADRDVASAVLANCCTRVAFRVSDRDARELESGFAHFSACDLQNLGVGEAVCRVERSEADFNLQIPEPDPEDERDAATTREAAVRASHARYARSRSEVEAELLASMRQQEPEPDTRKAAPVPSQASEARTVSEAEPPDVAEPTADSEPETRGSPATPPSIETHPALPKARPEFGRGGTEHRAIQQDVKECAEKLGFHVVIEKTVLGGAGFVDVSLEKEDRKIACEISVTRPAEDETANLRKCLAAGYEAVIAVASQKDHLIDLAKAIHTKLPDEDAKRIHVCLPGRFSSLLKRLIRHIKPSESAVARSGSYKIRRKYSEHSQDEQAVAAEQEFFRAISRVLRGE